MAQDIEKLRLNLTTAHLVEAGLVIGEPVALSVCPCCQEEKLDIAKRRRNTAYCESREDENWLVSCDACFREDVEHFAALWAEYYSGCM